MSDTSFKDISHDFLIKEGGGRWIRNVSPTCWISVLHRMTGFGYMEWETAICFLLPVEGRERTIMDQDCLIIIGDRRNELSGMTEEELRPWYDAHISGNRNSMETVLEVLKEDK